MTLHNIQPLLNKNYLKATSSRGIYIFDEHGKAYMDGSSGPVTCSLGHAHPKITEHIKARADKLIYVYRSQFGSQEAEYLASLLYAKSPEKSLAYTFFVNSGSEAIETAMKIAIQYWQEKGHADKRQFITRGKSYHGITLGALSLSGHPLRRIRFEKSLLPLLPLLSDLEHSTVAEQMDEFVQVIESAGSDTIAAFVAEPVVGAAGTALTPKAGYYEGIREVCDAYGLLFIADEVMTGLGRTGRWFGLEHWHTKADIVAIGKSLGAGYAPIAATLLTEEIISPIKKGSGLIMSGHTYSGHPLSCAIATRVLEVIEEDHLIPQVTESGIYLKACLDSLKEKFNFIHTVRGKGLMLGIEFDPAITGLASKCIDLCFDQGLLIYPSVGGSDGKSENGILIAPPFIITRTQIDLLISKLHYALEQIKAMG